MSKYFFWDNAARPMKLGGSTYVFEVVSRIGGSVQGVIEIADDHAPTFAAQTAHLGVTEITQAEWEAELAKKKVVGPLRRIRSMNASLSPLSTARSLAVNAGVVDGAGSVAVPMKGNGGTVASPEAVKSAQEAKAEGSALPSADNVFPEGRITKDPDTGKMVVKPPTRRGPGRTKKAAA